tara:strand:- start:577 stop:1404 length:828 start_codon:yes stop_codon:yes gene_type:complete
LAGFRGLLDNWQTLFADAPHLSFIEKIILTRPSSHSRATVAPMTEGYFADDETRAERVQALFDTIASRYDRINNLQSFWLHHRWKRRLVELAQIQPGHHALDLCCGTGDIARALLHQGAKVTALDFSVEMLKVARTKTAVQVEYLQRDALETGLPADQFHAVTIAYGLRNLADFEGGLREMYRVTRPGGRLCILDFGKPPNALVRFCYQGYLKWIVPVFGRLFCNDALAYAYIHQSLQDYPAQKGTAAALNQLGCREVETHNLMLGCMTIAVGIK